MAKSPSPVDTPESVLVAFDQMFPIRSPNEDMVLEEYPHTAKAMESVSGGVVEATASKLLSMLKVSPETVHETWVAYIPSVEGVVNS